MMNSLRAGAVETPEVIEESGIGTSKDFEAEVIVHNCHCHTYQDVISLFCHIIPCMTPSRAFELAWRIDHQGRAGVYQGERKHAERIGAQLAAGGLRVEVR